MRWFIAGFLSLLAGIAQAQSISSPASGPWSGSSNTAGDVICGAGGITIKDCGGFLTATSSFVGLGTTSALNTGDQLALKNTANAVGGLSIVNTNSGGSAQAALIFGTNNSNNVASISLYGGGNTGCTGATQVLCINGIGIAIQGGGTTAILVDGTPHIFFQNQPTVVAGVNGAVCASTAGQIGLNTANCIASFAAVKTDIKPIEDGLDVIMKLKPKYYRYTAAYLASQKDNSDLNGEQPGFLADDLVNLDKRDAIVVDGKPFGVRYEQMTAQLVSAIQTQQHEIEALRARRWCFAGWCF